ncbi:hypothetical protein Plim_1927 [Planctopirus limnophila DSM 3776]|uniref:Uncharacterized protein n=1 Tax=Planctopirus limnophila (strain ATCC 43296 / DSM 3776 / IFAM 1008 / Mu 290) TaxID=521674 RepID=D5SXS0_PLAL2|nr:hypothetical protein [Planctopirus limnophila]ADG67757.1 hypothetical protein Plim_1927 [Planctopirus limnophila DSM 3776]
MPSPNGFDSRLDTLVTEIRTVMSHETASSSDAARSEFISWLHSHASEVAQIRYDRTPTGFCRTIVAGEADLQRFLAESGKESH